MVQAVTARRKKAVRGILQRLPEKDRRQLTHVFSLFADAVGEPREQDLWALGWMAATPAPPSLLSQFPEVAFQGSSPLGARPRSAGPPTHRYPRRSTPRMNW